MYREREGGEEQAAVANHARNVEGAQL